VATCPSRAAPSWRTSFFLDRDFGLIHVKVQTWFPFRIQVYVNGHEWLARRLDRSRIPYLKYDNAFLRIANFRRAQSISDRFATLPWVRILHAYARKVNPLLGKLLGPMQYYWATAQAERRSSAFVGESTATASALPGGSDDPSLALQQLDTLTSRRRAPSGRTAKPFNPLAKTDRTLFRALLSGEHFIHGFTNRDLRVKLRDLGFPLHPEVPRQTGQVCRLLAPCARRGRCAR
jgi:hypothetical protein